MEIGLDVEVELLLQGALDFRMGLDLAEFLVVPFTGMLEAALVFERAVAVVEIVAGVDFPNRLPCRRSIRLQGRFS